MSRLTEKRKEPLTTKWEDVPTSYYKIKGDNTGVCISEIPRLNKLGKLEDLEFILKNGFTDKNGIFHEQVYLAYIDEEWCICDLKTDEWFLVSEVLDSE